VAEGDAIRQLLARAAERDEEALRERMRAAREAVLAADDAWAESGDVQDGERS
jgi:hypothetical protein